MAGQAKKAAWDWTRGRVTRRTRRERHARLTCGSTRVTQKLEPHLASSGALPLTLFAGRSAGAATGATGAPLTCTCGVGVGAAELPGGDGAGDGDGEALCWRWWLAWAAVGGAPGWPWPAVGGWERTACDMGERKKRRWRRRVEALLVVLTTFQAATTQAGRTGTCGLLVPASRRARATASSLLRLANTHGNPPLSPVRLRLHLHLHSPATVRHVARNSTHARVLLPATMPLGSPLHHAVIVNLSLRTYLTHHLTSTEIN